MRFLVLAFCMLAAVLPAKATVIELGPNFYIGQIEGPSFSIENFQVGTRTTTTSVSGSGSAQSIINDWDSAEIRTSLGAGAGEATASLRNSATFDLVFDSAGDIGLVFGFGLDGLGDAGVFDIDAGDNAFASWDMAIDIEGFPRLVDLTQEARCSAVSDAGGCFQFFDSSEALFVSTLTDDLSLSITTSMRFDIGVSRAAVAVTEPGALALILLPLGLIARRAWRRAATI